MYKIKINVYPDYTKLYNSLVNFAMWNPLFSHGWDPCSLTSGYIYNFCHGFFSLHVRYKHLNSFHCLPDGSSDSLWRMV